MTRTVTQAWAAVPRATQYEVQYRVIGDPTWSASIFTSTNSIDLQLEEGQSYQIRVRTICGSDTSDWAYGGIPVYSNDATCPAPTGVQVEQQGQNFIFTWLPTSSATGWNFRYRVTGQLAWTTLTLTNPTVTLTGLVVGASYEYQVNTVCNGSTTSDWGNTGYFSAGSSSATQRCPISYEEDEDFSGTLIGRKDGSNIVTLSGNLVYGASLPPASGDFIIAGQVALCCAPAADTTVPVSATGFTGELTISASGQLTLYVSTFTGSMPITIALSGLSYQGFTGTCPPVTPDDPNPPVSTQLNGKLSITCNDHGCSQQGNQTISITFPAATPAAVTLYLGFVDHVSSGNRYAGSAIFTPPAGAIPNTFYPSATAPFVLNIPAGVTAFTSPTNIYLDGYANNISASWVCHSCLNPISDLYVRVVSPSGYTANFTKESSNYSGLTLHNV